MLHKKIIFLIISLIWGLVMVLGAIHMLQNDAVSIEEKVTNNVKQTGIVNAYNAEIVRCDNLFTDNSPSWSECINNASQDFEIDLLDKEHYQKLRNQIKSIIEN